MGQYRTLVSHGVQCADSVSSTRVQKRVGLSRLAPTDSFGWPIKCEQPALDNASLARWPKWHMLPKVPALIIASSMSCFEHARRQLNASTQLSAIRVVAQYAIGNETAGRGSCADNAAQRTNDGVTAAHRAAWQHIVQSNVSMVVLEEDAEPVGDAADVHSFLGRCAEIGCDLAYLGVFGDVPTHVSFRTLRTWGRVGSRRIETLQVGAEPSDGRPLVCGQFFGSFAYWASPAAAAHMLRVATKPACNPHKPDHAMRWACLGPALGHCLARPKRSMPTCDVANLTAISPPPLRCLKPNRVLWVRELEGIGLFGMNHRDLSSQVRLERTTPNRTSQAVGPALRTQATREGQCRMMLTSRYQSSATRLRPK
jgi:hypothetical protein